MQHTTQGTFEILFGRLRDAAQSLVDEGLIAPPSGLVNLIPKPLKDVVVDPDGDSRLAGRGAKNGTATTVPKIVLLLHRGRSSRHVYATTRIRPSASIPSVTNRSSSSEVSSEMVIACLS